MQRVKITLAYDGSFFNGFQRQKHENQLRYSVCFTLEKALRKLNISSAIVGSGRTDANVHALNQIVHLDIPPFWNDLNALLYHLNKQIAPHLWVKKIIWVEAQFHARFSATKRLYRYIVYDGPYQPFLASYALHIPTIDVPLLHTTAKLFEGEHRFGYFKKEGGGKTGELRKIFKAGAYRHGRFIVIYFLGDAFLRSQVRMMCDMLIKVNEGIFSQEDLILQRDKVVKRSTTLVPPSGLYLSRIHY